MGDFKGLAGLISKFIYSDKKYNELGLNGIKYSQEEFDKKRLIIKLNNIFKCVLDDTKK